MTLFEPEERRVFTVSRLAADVRRMLETGFPLIWVEGEVSNLSRPGSGHWYFTLKDERAQIRCAMFANRNRSIRFQPANGMHVTVRGRVSLYEARGDFQLLADFLEPAGEGALRAAFDALKLRLEQEGLFADARKQTLPRLPQRIGVITSSSGAALRDILAVLKRRCPAADVVLLPVAVQGRDAEAQINRAFARVSAWDASLGPRPDVILLARGGGSLEDLWAFNLESVARSIAACDIPVVVGVGHETDFTIADFVADMRAPTPSAAAELVAPDLQECRMQIQRARRALQSQMLHRLRSCQQSLTHGSHRLTHPGRALQQRMQRIDDYERELQACMQQAVERRRHRFSLVGMRLAQLHPARRIEQAGRELAQQTGVLRRSLVRQLERRNTALAGVGRALNAVSPLATLSRGYAIVMQPPTAGARFGTPITTVADTHPGARIVARLQDGELDCNVNEVKPDES
jgi:exodeoxyribonuclease VII large subunit